ncbi:MAG TPA: hypothetical protein DEH10_17365 [Pseudomonas sp.]|nr:hypothetical protein [Pseudomonas sp.]
MPLQVTLSGQAIARRVGVGKQLLLADLREENARTAAEVWANAGNLHCHCRRYMPWPRRPWR